MDNPRDSPQKRRWALVAELENWNAYKNCRTPMERAALFDEACRARGIPLDDVEEVEDDGTNSANSVSDSMECDSIGSGGPSSDDSDTADIVITGDELWLRPKKEDPKRRIYGRETLLSVIPDTQEYELLREKLRIQKTVYRWDINMSNLTFKSKYYKEHKCGVPKELKKFKVVLKGNDLNPFYGKDRPFYKKGVPFGGKEPRPVLFRVQDGRVVKQRLKWKGEPPTFVNSFFAKSVTRAYEARPRKRPITFEKVEGVWVEKDPDGQTIKKPPNIPARHHKKYWYFYRKRGTWVPSQHHPYGDEEDLYPHSN